MLFATFDTNSYLWGILTGIAAILIYAVFLSNKEKAKETKEEDQADWWKRGEKHPYDCD